MMKAMEAMIERKKPLLPSSPSPSLPPRPLPAVLLQTHADILLLLLPLLLLPLPFKPQKQR